MIDWLTVLVPYSHIEPLKGGKIISIDPDENIEWSTIKKLPVRGSYESNLLVCSDESTRADDGSYTRLYIDGNLAKFHQGHNFTKMGFNLCLALSIIHHMPTKWRFQIFCL